MRIDCEQCRTRYAIPDERLRGRVCRFRCRRCGHSMLLRGDQLPAAAADATVVQRHDFGDAFDAPQAEPPQAAALDPTGVDDDPFASRAAAVPDEEAFAAPDRALQPPVEEPSLTGARHETSMLFSLDNLKALAMTPSPQPRANGHATAKNESSGLIDIRALAARTLASAAPEPAGEAAAMFSVVPSVPLAMQAPAMPSMLMPEPERRAPPWAIALGAGGAMAAFAAIVLVAIVLRPTPRPEAKTAPASMISATSSPQPERVAMLDPKTTTPTAPLAPAGPANAVVSVTKPLAATTNETHERAREKHAGRASPTTPRATGAEKTPEKIGEKAPEKAKSTTPVASQGGEVVADRRDRARRDDIGDLLEVATKGDSKPPVVREAPSEPDLPVRLDMRDVKAGMAQAQARVSACYAQFHVPGNAVVDASIAPSGRVESARVGGALAGTPTGDCVARAVKSTTFKRFKGPASMSINYPFILR